MVPTQLVSWFFSCVQKDTCRRGRQGAGPRVTSGSRALCAFLILGVWLPSSRSQSARWIIGPRVQVPDSRKVGRGGREVFSRVTPTRRHCSPRPGGAWGVSAPRRARPSHGAPSPDGGGQRTGRRLAASAGTAFNSFLERSQSFRPVACHGRLEGERGDRVQGAGAGGALTCCRTAAGAGHTPPHAGGRTAL